MMGWRSLGNARAWGCDLVPPPDPRPTLRQRFKCKRFIWETKESASGRMGKQEKRSQPIKATLESQLPWRVTGAASCGETLENEIEHRPQSSHWRDNGSVVFIHQIPVTGGGKLLGVSSLVLPVCHACLTEQPSEVLEKTSSIHAYMHANTSIHAPLDIGVRTLTWPQDCAKPPGRLLWFIRRAAGEKARDGGKGQILRTLYKLFLGVLFGIKGAILEYFRQENRIKFEFERGLWLEGGGADNKSREPVR